jgi:Tfp pilus assembly protein PilW
MTQQRSNVKGRVSSARVAGFSFLEVLIALCVVLIALVPLIRLHLTSIHMIDSSSRRARAMLLANAKMTEIIAMETPDLGGKSKGRVEDECGVVFSWSRMVKDAELSDVTETPLPGLCQVHVDVTWKDGRQDAVVSADTFVHFPTPNAQKGAVDRYGSSKPNAAASRSRM